MRVLRNLFNSIPRARRTGAGKRAYVDAVRSGEHARHQRHHLHIRRCAGPVARPGQVDLLPDQTGQAAPLSQAHCRTASGPPVPVTDRWIQGHMIARSRPRRWPVAEPSAERNRLSLRGQGVAVHVDDQVVPFRDVKPLERKGVRGASEEGDGGLGESDPAVAQVIPPSSGNPASSGTPASHSARSSPKSAV